MEFFSEMWVLFLFLYFWKIIVSMISTERGLLFCQNKYPIVA